MGKKKSDALDEIKKPSGESIDDLVAESSEEVLSTNIPPFCKAKFLVVKKTHPSKEMDTRGGFVLSLILISYLIDNKGNEEKLVVVERDEPEKGKKLGALQISFPKGTSGLKAIMYCGPKSTIKFQKDKKWFQVDKKKFDYKYFLEWFSKKNPASKNMDDNELDEHYVEYLENFWNFGLAQNFGNDASEANIPTVGMATYFYRKYTPAKEGEKYGNTNISKWPGAALKEKFPAIDGKFTFVDEAIAQAILDAYDATKTKKNDVDFNYGENAKDAPAVDDVI